MNIALVRNGVVENVIVGTLEFAQTLGYDACVETDTAGIGWSYDGNTGEFAPPEPPEPVPEQRHVTRLAFRNRFTQAELITLEIASLDDPAAPMPQRQQAAAIRVMMRQVDTASFIDLDRADTRGGVQQLEAAGLLGAGRALVILDTPIDPMERPQ